MIEPDLFGEEAKRKVEDIKRLHTLDRGSGAQRQNIERVRSSIGRSVLGFVHRLGVGTEFNVADLTRHVQAQTSSAPASADRILRDLRQRGFYDYEVVKRSEARYRITAINFEVG